MNETVTFGNAHENTTSVDTMQNIIDKAKNVIDTYNSTEHKADGGKKAQEVVDSFREVGLNSAKYNIINSDKEEVTVNEHGITCRTWDEENNDYSSKQLKIISNTLAFTDDNWATVKTALGELQYYLNDELHSDYGLNADTVIGGKVIAGDVYSMNYKGHYEDKNGNIITDIDKATEQGAEIKEIVDSGSHINLTDGSFGLADGKISYNNLDNKLEVKGYISADTFDIDGNTISVEEKTIEVGNIGGADNVELPVYPSSAIASNKNVFAIDPNLNLYIDNALYLQGYLNCKGNVIGNNLMGGNINTEKGHFMTTYTKNANVDTLISNYISNAKMTKTKDLSTELISLYNTSDYHNSNIKSATFKAWRSGNVETFYLLIEPTASGADNTWHGFIETKKNLKPPVQIAQDFTDIDDSNNRIRLRINTDGTMEFRTKVVTTYQLSWTYVGEIQDVVTDINILNGSSTGNGGSVIA